MKGLGFSTILLVLATVLIVISVALLGFVMYRLSISTVADKTTDFWNKNKLFMMAPSVMNVVSMALLGVLFAMG